MQTHLLLSAAARPLCLCGTLLLASCMSDSTASRSPAPPLAYPITAKVAHEDLLHGTTVPDPYRWLEDDHSAETKAWVEAQNKVTFGYLEKIPQRDAIQARLTKLWNYERYGLPFKEGGRYFFSKNDGLQNQSVLYTLKTLDAEPRVLLDPNTFSADGTVSLATYSVTDDGKLIAYATSAAGSDWNEFRVRDIESGADLPDHLKWIKSSGAAWTKDGKGFFYSRYDEPASTNQLKGVNYFHKLYYHRLGDPQSADQLIYHRPDQKEWGFGAGVTDDGRYLVISVWQGTDTKNRFFYKDLADVGLTNAGSSVIELHRDFDADYSFIDNLGPVFYFRTDLNAPRGRIIAVDVTRPARSEWKEVVPQTADRLEGVNLVNHQLVAFYLHDAHTAIRIHDLDGTLARTVTLPGIGTAGGFGGKRADAETFYAFTSYTAPTTIYRYEMPLEKFERDASPGYYGAHLSREIVQPLSVEPIPDLLAAHAAAGSELRITPSLWPLHDALLKATLHFSMIRMRNAAVRD